MKSSNIKKTQDLIKNEIYSFKDKRINMVDISKKNDQKNCICIIDNYLFKISKNFLEDGSPKGEIFNTARCAELWPQKKLVK